MQDLQEIINMTVENIKKSLSAEEIVGKPIVNGDGTLILPVSKISVGFVGGKSDAEKDKNAKYPMGISGGGISVVPIGFLVCGEQKKFVKVDGEGQNKWLDLAKSVIGVMKKDD